MTTGVDTLVPPKFSQSFHDYGTVVTTGVDTLVPPRRTRSFHDHGTGVTMPMERP